MQINDYFIVDIEPIYKTLNYEKKHFYVMGDFNISQYAKYVR